MKWSHDISNGILNGCLSFILIHTDGYVQYRSFFSWINRIYWLKKWKQLKANYQIILLNLIDIKHLVSTPQNDWLPKRSIFIHAMRISGDALIEPGEDPEVIRAKYFIRDEFLVSVRLAHYWRGPMDDLQSYFIRNILQNWKYLLIKFQLQFTAYIDSQWRWQALLLPTLYMCRWYGKYKKGVQRLSRYYSKNASSSIWTFIGN